MRKIILGAFIVFICPFVSSLASASDEIYKIISLPEEEIDLSIAKLTIDKIVDPSIDIATNEVLINQSVVAIKKMVPENASSMEKLLAVRAYMFESGSWNHFQTYQYNFDDPEGKDLQSSLIPNLLKTRKGNCVSLPVLFVILGQKTGINVTLANAPLHLFVKFTESETGKELNIEATNGGNPFRDEWIIEQSKISLLAVETGIYLKPLTKRESVAELSMSAVSSFLSRGELEKVIEVTDLMLEYHPKSVNAMLAKGSAYYLMREVEERKYAAHLQEMPIDFKNYLLALSESNQFWFKKAESLGWHEPTTQDEDAYRKTIEAQKEKSRASGI